MDDVTARMLCDLNTRFYRAQAASFSATRQAPWEGWRRCLAVALEALAAAPDGGCATDAAAPGDGCAAGGGAPDGTRGRRACEPSAPAARGDGRRADAAGARSGRARTPAALSVLDVACGNLRFERFLGEVLPGAALRVDAVDNCAPLAADAAAPDGVRFREQDVASALLAGGDALAALAPAPCDLAVSFGFLHHIPGFEARAGLLAALLGAVRPGGVAAVSLWRFLDDGRLARKATADHARALAELGIDAAALDAGDRILGWQGAPSAWRYCHHFDEAEVDALAAAALAARPGSRELARLDADGASGRLNRYLILQAPA